MTNQNGHFTVVLYIVNPGQYAVSGQQWMLEGDAVVREIPVTGQFINTDGAHEYDGGLQGVIMPGSRKLVYSYTQNNGAKGSGTFTLSNDGSSLTGDGESAEGEKFAWNGTRAN